MATRNGETRYAPDMPARGPHMPVETLTARPDPAATAARLAEVAPADTLSPADRYLELFVEVQSRRVFADSKTFVDCGPRFEPGTILEAYRREKGQPGFDLAAFVARNFEAPAQAASGYVSPPDQTLPDHIDALWDVLTRHPDAHPPQSSLLPLPHPYVVPGGRFSELYYWDSYFTMLGLCESGRKDLLGNMADNFAWLIDTYGHIPNGTRTYYLSRSQPPVFALMVELFEQHGIDPALRYLPQLRKEYAFWMDGADELRPGDHRRSVVRLDSGAVLNRYWDDRDTPREESFIEDVTTARASGRPVHEVYRELRAAAASGWDFSSRWLAQPDRLDSIRTTAILPVDLNAFLYKLECTIAGLSNGAGDAVTADDFRERAQARKQAMRALMWDEATGAYLDYDWTTEQRRALNAAALAPLYVGMAEPGEARRTAAGVRHSLLQEGGLATTTLANTGQQWDQPNGWAPLQWLAINGLARYGIHDLAGDIAQRWLATVSRLYQRQNKLVEKYALHSAEGGGGGEYPLQDGFGWTNGVVRKLLNQYPRHPAAQSRAGSG
jgi:alpha,alpha-trehalase